MRKVMLLASMLAMVMLAASPALAQTGGSGGDAADDSIGGAGGDATDNSTSAQYSAQLCQNIIGDIVVANENTAAQYGGDDAASQYVDGDANDLSLSQDEAQAIAQENNTTINIVQQCFQQNQQAQGEDISQAQAGAQQGTAGGTQGDVAGDTNGDGVVTQEDDVNGDGVVDTADDINGDGIVNEGDAAAVADAGDAAATADAGDAAATAEAGDAAATADAGDEGAVAVLPDTGGASLFTLAAGALLVAGGLLARRIVR